MSDTSTPRYGYDTTAETVASDLAAHIKEKVILTTGVSPNSLGAAFVTAIAAHQPRLLILAGRNLSKTRETATAIASATPGVQTRVLELDLASQTQVRKTAAEVLAYEENIDVLVLNAGIGAVDYGTTPDGIESQFGANYIGHFLFANLIMLKVLGSSGGGRIVSVASDGYRLSPVRFDDLGFHGGETYHPWRAYGQSKSANMLLAVSLAEKLEKRGLVAVSLHPGVIGTNLVQQVTDLQPLIDLDRAQGNPHGWWDYSTMQYKSFSQGVATHVFAAFEPSLKDYNGRFLQDSSVVPMNEVRAWARDPFEAERLWQVSEDIVGQKFEY